MLYSVVQNKAVQYNILQLNRFCVPCPARVSCCNPATDPFSYLVGLGDWVTPFYTSIYFHTKKEKGSKEYHTTLIKTNIIGTTIE